MSFKAHFRRFLAADPERLHFAAHSHHYWPDVTFDAQQRCWEDAARLADRKWAHFFATVYPSVQDRVAKLLNLPDPASLAFGPNTHGFLLRILSSLPQDRPLRVLTTNGEFHSFTRQMHRLEEDGLVKLRRVPAQPFETFAARFAAAGREGVWDLIYFSQVFYNSGYGVADLNALAAALAEACETIVVDGYHGFLALPTDLSALAGRVFYLSGGYKYAMAGEGACFLHAPAGKAPRPRDTGWYAAFAALESGSGGAVAYPEDGARFLGATFDPAGIYRLEAVLRWLEETGVTVAQIHAHAQALQRLFLEKLDRLYLADLHCGQLAVSPASPNCSHFLTFETDQAEELHARLLQANVVTDHRGPRLRFGFGLYHDIADVERLCGRLAEVLS